MWEGLKIGQNRGMATLTEVLVKQRRFKLLLLGLVVWGLCLGLLIVPVESRYEGANINTMFDGVWWAVTTITSVGYGDTFPVSKTGKVMGMMLEVAGVLAFGLLISLVTIALSEAKDNYNRKRLFERLDGIEEKLEKMEKKEEFLVRGGGEV